MENSDEIVLKDSDMRLKESDMLVKEIGIIKHNNSRVIAGKFGPKAPANYRDAIFVAHLRPTKEMDPEQCIADIDENNIVSFVGGCTYHDSLGDETMRIYGHSFSSMQHAEHQASVYVSMLNNMTEQAWQQEINRDHYYRQPTGLFTRNMLSGDDWIGLTHRNDLDVAIPITGWDHCDYDYDYEDEISEEKYNRVYPKRAVTGRCVEVLSNAVIMNNIKGFGDATHVDMGFAVTDEEKALLQKTIDAKAPVQLAVSVDGKSFMVNAGELGKVVTKHNDVSIPKLFVEKGTPYNHYDGWFFTVPTPAQITGKLIHVHDTEKVTNRGRQYSIELVKKYDGKRVLMDMEVDDASVIRSAKRMEGRSVILSFFDGNQLTGVRDLSREKKGKGLSL